jgi:YfiH family protein
VHEPRLTRVTQAGCTFWIDEVLEARTGIVVAFSERTGGLSTTPYASLNLAAHVGDRPAAVDENRARFMAALGVVSLRDRLVTAEQVHGAHVTLVDQTDAGRGAWASGGSAPIEGADGLVTCSVDLPLMLLFADCVPIVLVAMTMQFSAVGVVHAGWRGAHLRIPAAGVRAISQATGCDPCNVLAYIGPHICASDYEVGPEVLSQFDKRFATVSRAGTGTLDLGAAVSANLLEAGVSMSAQCSIDACTAEHRDRFYSHRAEGVTGRQAAFAVVRQREA